MKDISYSTEDYIFSYRAAGILVHENKVLLQKPNNSNDYAFPGGQIAFGETNAETLIREFREEIGADIEIGELKWVWENIGPWDGKSAHQICLFFSVNLKNMMQIPLAGNFNGKEHDADDNNAIWFHWIPFDEIENIMVHPGNTMELLLCLDEGAKHFVYRERETI
jgi:ADP-ribose pyrophosphatase YjhB (NUDIX family)